ncbi:EF hand [Trichuris suis]|nr:EF hand [Trichuris suis]
MKREELNFITQLDADTFMGGSDLKTGKAAIAIRKKKRREGKKREKETNSIVVACLKRLLPVGLNVFGGRELELLQKIKEKHLKEDIFDKSYWQRQLYHKIGKAQMLGISSMNQEAVLEAITSMGLTLYNLHTDFVEKGANVKRTKDEAEEEDLQMPDSLSQLIQCFQRAATAERKQLVTIERDELYKEFVRVMAISIHVGEEEEDGNADEAVNMEAQELEKQELRHQQARLADRGAAVMVLMYLSACHGEPNDMVDGTLKLGIHILNGGNSMVQDMMLAYLQDKKDVSFFSSIAGLMNRGSVLNLEIFERQIKAEGLGMGAELSLGDHQNLNDAEFICTLFRFIQLTCEGHNSEFQNYLRNQPGNTTSVNLIICTVDYLLRLQESIMDFYWHYFSKELVDEAGKANFLRALSVCSQVFNTLTESVQGPCVGNQMALANSRLWDAINGFFFLFANMMDKLSKNHTQLELLREFLSLQKDMIVLMLSMLEGNVLNGSIGKQMVDTLAESQQNVQLILKFFDMFLKLKDLTTSQAFQEFDLNKDGWISPKEFQRAMEGQKMYSIEEINYLMMCTDVNNDGKIDYMEFTERFHNPAKDIGFNLAVLLTNLKEHIVGDNRLDVILQTASSMCDYFDPFLGRIEIMGSNKRVEKVYFEIKEEWLEQFNKPQIKQSKKDFLFNVLQDDGGQQGKLEAFVNFCEDTIFEMSHAAEISSEDKDSRVERAKRQREIFTGQTERHDTSESQKSFEQDDKVRFQATAYEPKIADVTPKSRGSIFNVLARNFYVLKYITLALAFLINAILLFYRVSVNTAEISDSFAAPPESGNATTSEVEVEEELSIHENYYYLTHVLKCLSVGHCLVSLALLIAYYQLKSFQYLMMYLFFSAVGIWNPFFYAGHLIDVVFSFPMLQTILKSVTHNGKQLILTVMMVVVVVYMYTVLAFNFFRKFYVQDEDGQETDSKCNNMITCFVFNIYAGIRAGGGIGDELQSPYGDEKEAWRILFDVTFYFFIIIILLAIMQGETSNLPCVAA